MKEYKARLDEFEEIGTVKEFATLKEKAIPKKVLFEGANWYRCPNGCEIHKKQFEKDWYCPKCGQRIFYKENMEEN